MRWRIVATMVVTVITLSLVLGWLPRGSEGFLTPEDTVNASALKPYPPVNMSDFHALRPEARALEPPVARVANEYVEVLVDDDGQFVINTTGGDPSFPGDDNKRLMYSDAGEIWSSFTSLRLVTDQETPLDFSLRDSDPVTAPVVNGDTISTTWVTRTIQIEQLLTPVLNPSTGREDTVRIEYTVTNLDSQAHSAGIRCMLAVMI